MSRSRATPTDATDDATRLGSPEGAAPTDDPPEPGPELLTLEELAERSGVSPRTIRFYQGEKLLPKPDRDRRDGRLARYDTGFIDRLRLIGELRDRGLKLPAIRDLLAEGDASTRVADWLGLDNSLRGSWRLDAPRLIERSGLAELLANAAPGTQGQLEEAHLLVRHGDAWLAPNPNLLDLTLRLLGEGIRIDLVIEAGAILQRHLAKAANELIDLFVTALDQGFGNGVDTATLADALRPAARDAAQMIFGQELERAVEGLLGDTRRISRR